MTKIEAIMKLIEENGREAGWEEIYAGIEKYYPAAKRSTEWKAGLRGVLYRELRNGRSLKRTGNGTFALK